jgi:hypothetical protein
MTIRVFFWCRTKQEKHATKQKRPPLFGFGVFDVTNGEIDYRL